MKLHEDRVAFEVIIGELAKRHKIRRDVLEKDYYVTLLLEELSLKPNQNYAYFKGGTALYKALKSIRRFSEDIDLTVLIEDCPNPSQAKKRLENASLKYACLKKGETLINTRGSITCEYLYNSLFALDENDALQRFGKVKVEATSFTVSEPTNRIEISPHLYELAGLEEKAILTNVYDVKPFEIETISLERIFIDKIFAAEFYYERKNFFDVAKHVYDLTVLLENEQIKRFLQNPQRVRTIIAYKRKEERNRLGGIPEEKKIKDFEFFGALCSNKEFIATYKKMQRIYVLNEKDEIKLEVALAAMSELYSIADVEN